MGDLSANFNRAEFACRCCKKLPVTPPPVFLKKLEKARALHYPTGLVIASGYRCAAHNRAAGGKPNSRHRIGDAIDFKHPRMTLKQARALGFRGVGVIAASGLVLHVDDGPVRTWYYDAQGNTP